MATIKSVYELLKKKKTSGEKIGILGQSFIEAFEEEKEISNTKEVHLSFIKHKDKKDK